MTLLRFYSRRFILLVLSILIPAFAYPKENIDSLKAFVPHAASDSLKADALTKLSKAYRNSHPDSALSYARAAFEIGRRSYPSVTTNKSYLCLGIALEIVRNYDSAYYYLDKAIAYCEESRDGITLASAYNSMGVVCNKMGNSEKAISSYIKALKQHELNKNEQGMALAYNNLGVMYKKGRQYERAIEQYKNAWKLYEKNHEQNTLVLTNIAGVYFVMKKYDDAIIFLQKAKKIDEANNNMENLSRLLDNLTSCYIGKNDLVNAKSNNEEAIALSEKYKNYEQMISGYENKATIFTMEHKYSEAVIYFIKAIVTARHINATPKVTELTKSLSLAYKNTGQHELSAQYALAYADMKDSLMEIENKKQIAEMQAKYESAQKDKELLLKDTQIIKEQSESRQKSMQRNAFIIGFILMLTLVFFIFKSYREKKKANERVSLQKEIIEQKQKEILDSIHYAQKIQQSLLPTERYIERTLKRLKKR